MYTRGYGGTWDIWKMVETKLHRILAKKSLQGIIWGKNYKMLDLVWHVFLVLSTDDGIDIWTCYDNVTCELLSANAKNYSAQPEQFLNEMKIRMLQDKWKDLKALAVGKVWEQSSLRL